MVFCTRVPPYKGANQPSLGETEHKNPKIGQNFPLFWLIWPILQLFWRKRKQKKMIFEDFTNFEDFLLKSNNWLLWISLLKTR